MELAADARPDARQPRGGRPLRRLQPDERRLPPQPARDGRRASGRHEAAGPARLARPALAGLRKVGALGGDGAGLPPPRAPFELLFMDGGGYKLDLDAAARMLELVAPGGLAVADDMTPGYGPDPVRDLFFGHPEFVTVEILTTPESAALLATRLKAPLAAPSSG